MSDVSVVIPTYNRARILPRAVESALHQTVPPLEVVVVDDGSTDDTAAVCESFGEAVRYLRVSNGGVSRARNIGIAAARGALVALLDSDDAWLPNKLEVQLAALAAYPQAQWSITGCELLDAAGRHADGPQSFAGAFPVFRDMELEPASAFSRALAPLDVDTESGRHHCFGGDLFPLLLLGNMGLPSSVLVRRHAFDTVGMFDPALRLAEETDFFLRIATAFPTVIVMTPVVQYRLAQSDSLTTSANAAALSTAALQCLDSAVGRRGRPLTDGERSALRSGRRSLLLRLAYAELSGYHGAAARRALAQVFWECSPLDARAASLWALSLAPSVLLRGLHALKRAARRARR